MARIVKGHWLALLLFLSYIFALSGLSFARHDSFHTSTFDLGYYDQVIWNTAHGRLFQNSFVVKPENYLSDHFSPILALVSTVYWVWPNVKALLLLQTIALAAGGIPVYFLVAGKSRLAAGALLLAYYLNPALHAINLADFHEISLAVPFILAALYFLIQGRAGPFFLFIVLALLVKEEIFVLTVTIGIYLLIKPDTRRWGSAVICLGLLWICLTIGVQRLISDQALPQLKSRYTYLGESPAEAVERILKDPGILARNLFVRQKLQATWRVVSPTGLLPLLSPGLAALSLPVFLYLQLSDDFWQSTLGGWYPAPLMPVLYIAAGAGLLRLKDKARALAVLLLLSASLFGYRAYGEGPLGRYFDPQRFAATPRARVGHNLLKSIPRGASVSAQGHLGPHLSQRHEIYLFPYPWTEKAEFIALDREAPPWTYAPTSEEDFRVLVNRLISSPQYDIIADQQGYLFLYQTSSRSIPFPFAASWKVGLSLVGFDVAVEQDDGSFVETKLPLRMDTKGRLRLSLWWRASSRLPKDYTVFVHMVDQADRKFGQHDGLPAGGARPTSTWNPGELIRDIHYVPYEIPPGVSQGRIVAGLYQWETGERLSLVAGQDHVVLTEVMATPVSD